MPILDREPDVFPEHLFAESVPCQEADERAWYVLHTRPRQEKSVARDLHQRAIPFYLPLVPRRILVRRRPMTSYLPLFSGYVFLLANRDEHELVRISARIARVMQVIDQGRLRRDLKQVYRLIAAKDAIILEPGLCPGTLVEIISGPLAGLRGKVVRQTSGCRFVVEVDFIRQGASVMVDEATLAPVAD